MDQTFNGIDPDPKTRIRIGHKTTASRGWEYESTVEVEFVGSGGATDYAALCRMEELLAEARRLGAAECAIRNAGGAA